MKSTAIVLMFFISSMVLCLDRSGNDPHKTGVLNSESKGFFNNSTLFLSSDSLYSTISSGNYRACATFTSHLTGAVYTAVSEYVPPGSSNPDKIKLFVSYDRGSSWIVKSIYEGFESSVDCRPNELDLEVIISGSDTIAFIAVGYDFAGHSLSGLLKVNVATGVNNFSVWQFGGWSSSNVNNYNPKVTSNNTKYGSTTAVFMTVSFDSALTSGFRTSQRFAAVLTPFTNNLFTFRIANPANGGFFWGHTPASRRYLSQDICYYDSAGIDIIYTVYNNKVNFAFWALTAKSYDYGLSSISATQTALLMNDSVDQFKIVSCGGTNNQNLTIGFKQRNAALNNYDFRICHTSNGGHNWTNQYIESTTDTTIFIDIQAVKLSQARYKASYTTVGKKNFYRGFYHTNVSGIVFTPLQQVNNQPADINFYGIKAGYFNLPGGDSCLSFWGRDSSLGLTNLLQTNNCKIPVGLQGNVSIAGQYSLKQNFPNPFNPSTTINFSLDGQEDVKLAVYDLLGKEVIVLKNENLSPGNYSVTFDASGYTSGIYFYTLYAGGFTISRKMLLVK